MKQFRTSLFIFRRDLRVDDNTGLAQALAQSERVIPCFIFDPRQVGEHNSYRSDNAVQFMIESLKDLEKQLHKHHAKLYLFYGKADEVVQEIAQKKIIDAVFCNKDYTPFSLKRDETIEHVCIKNHIAFNTFNDALLFNPDEVKTGSGTPYSVFTAFYKHTAKTFSVETPEKLKHGSWYTEKIATEQPESIYKKVLSNDNPNIYTHGGRAAALKIIANLANFDDYASERDFPALDTTLLAAHHKFGTISIRESYHGMKDHLGINHPLLRQLYWRDFFSHVAYHSPFVFGSAFRPEYNKLAWQNDPKKFKAWCDGKTGFPIVDAGMRQLNETGFMHNRVRMIVASFLVKDLHIDWQWGEKYFAQKLIDYDPAVNNGNWQWAASTGCDAQPYFRIFNPWLQQKKFDPECTYIKQWVPELNKFSAKVIHEWHKSGAPACEYPRPVIAHEVESKKALELFKNA